MEEESKCTIKIIKIVNGVETVVDSTFDCDESMSWVSSTEGMEGKIEKMVHSILKEDGSGEFHLNLNMDFDEDEKDGVKIMKFKAGDGEEEVEMDFDFKMLDGKDGVLKMMINGEEMEVKVEDIHKHIEQHELGCSFTRDSFITLL